MSISPGRRPRSSCCRLRLFGVVFACLFIVATPVFGDTVRVTVDGALVWSQPSGISFVLTQLARNTQLDVVRRIADWYEIVLPVSRPGYLSGFIRISQVSVVSVGPMSAAARRAATARAGNTVRLRPAFLNLDAVYRAGGTDFTRTLPAFTETYAEAGSITSNYGKGDGPAFDVLGSQAVWGRIGVGFGFSFYSRSSPTIVSAQVPHPFFFNQPRAATFETKAPHGNEIAFHIPIVWIPVSGLRLKILVFGGPSVFRVTQNVVSAVTLNDPYPHDTVSITAVTTTRLQGTNAGFHAGADVAYFFGRSLGVGGGVRYSAATIKFKDDEGTSDGKAGGPQVNVGIRVRF